MELLRALGTLLRRVYLGASNGDLTDATDLYQLTMGQGYVGEDTADKPAVFTYYFRTLPFGGGYAISAGLAVFLEYVSQWKYTDDIIDFLKTINGADGQPLFRAEVLQRFKNERLRVTIHAVPEGRLVFPFEPVARVEGPILQCQLMETTLLCLLNFQSLIATKAARICYAAAGAPVLEFGLRRAQGIDGALSATRAAFIGGCVATSNVYAARKLGIPAKGTHAHSWVMSYRSELEAFMAYARQNPNNCILLVDTYDTLEGVRNAVKVGKWLREQGHDLLGVRLDSGDLAKLSRGAREILDAEGFPKAIVVASNDLDEFLIEDLRHQGAKINAFGVGTKMITGGEQPAFGGVYKLTAIRHAPSEGWTFPVKCAENPIKTSIPGILGVCRYYDENGKMVGDMIYDTSRPEHSSVIVDVANPMTVAKIKGSAGAPEEANGQKKVQQLGLRSYGLSKAKCCK